MPSIDTPKAGILESWLEKESKELAQLKKEMIKRVVDKMNLFFGKEMVADFLYDNWEIKDKINDMVLWMFMEFLGTSLEELISLRESIKNSKTKQQIDDIEKNMLANLNTKKWKKTTQKTEQKTTQQTYAFTKTSATETSVSKPVFEQSSTYVDKANPPQVKYSLDSAKVWEAKEVPKNQRMKRLFPSWTPKTEKEMRKYITKIDVPIRTAQWKDKKLTLSIHKKLANEYIAIFKEMYREWIPVNPSSTWWFVWRLMRRWRKLSHHSYWSAVDINWDVNWWVYWSTKKNSPYFNSQKMVAIRKRHWFYRWWDWSSRSYDPMHFTYMNG